MGDLSPCSWRVRWSYQTPSDPVGLNGSGTVVAVEMPSRSRPENEFLASEHFVAPLKTHVDVYHGNCATQCYSANATTHGRLQVYCSSRVFTGSTLVRGKVGRDVTHAPEQRKVECRTGSFRTSPPAPVGCSTRCTRTSPKRPEVDGRL